MWNSEKNYGFVRPETAHPASREDNLFFHGSSVLEAPGIDLKKGDAVEFQMDHDRTGRPRAINLKLVEPENAPYIERPGERRQYPTRVMRAEVPVEFEPAALRRDRGRRRDMRARWDSGAAERERIWSHPGADGL
jgi:cold shock CspA family protein